MDNLSLQNEVFLAYNKLLDKIELILTQKNIFYFHTSKKNINKRIGQLIYLESFHKFADLYLKNKINLNNPVPGFFLKNDSYIYPTKKNFFKLILKFFYNWMKEFFRFYFYLFFKNRIEKQVYSIADADGIGLINPKSMTELSNYLPNCEIKPLRNKNIIFKGNTFSKTLTSHNKYIYISPHPINDLLTTTNAPLKDSISFCYFHTLTIFIFLYNIIKNPISSLLARDFALHTPIFLANKKGLLNQYFISNSKTFNQELSYSSLASKRFSFNIFWYSTNNKLHSFNKDKRAIDYPIYRYLSADNAFVWNNDQSEWLSNITEIKQITISGPIIFQKFPTKVKKQNNEKFKILLFDVTPISSDLIKKNIGYIGYHYYNLENMMKFSTDIVEISKNIFSQPLITIKSKKKIGKAIKMSPLSCEYMKTLESISKSENISILSGNKNLLEIIPQYDLIISIPFTSTCYLASQLNIPSIYYDPTGLLYLNHKLEDNIFFVSGKKELKDLLKSF